MQDFDDEIKGAECKRIVKKYKQLAAEDVRFNLPLADACYEDRITLCADVPPVRSWTGRFRWLVSSLDCGA